MNRALVIKELRESLLLVGLAGLALLWILTNLWGWRVTPFDLQSATEYPFVYDDAAGMIGVVTALLALVLGLKQSAWEEFRGTYHYLLHRPMPRRRVFLLKLAIGLSLTLVVSAVTILLHGLWAATPGTHASPFFWSMTLPAWATWMAMPLVYFGAFLSGIRPGKWYGSRLLPAVAACFVAAILSVQPWWWLSPIVSAALSAVYVGCILSVARLRDY